MKPHDLPVWVLSGECSRVCYTMIGVDINPYQIGPGSNIAGLWMVS